jgi:hypothetical protein
VDNKSIRRPHTQNRGRGRSQGFLHANGNGHPNSNGPPPFLTGVDNGKLNPHVQRRTSGLPLPVRPSTPIRPALNRDPGSSSSTLVSSTYSIFSRSGPKTNELFSSVSSSTTVRSVSPSSPTTAKPRSSADLQLPASPVLANETIKLAVLKKADGTKPSWANLVARSASNV